MSETPRSSIDYRYNDDEDSHETGELVPHPVDVGGPPQSLSISNTTSVAQAQQLSAQALSAQTPISLTVPTQMGYAPAAPLTVSVPQQGAAFLTPTTPGAAPTTLVQPSFGGLAWNGLPQNHVFIINIGNGQGPSCPHCGKSIGQACPTCGKPHGSHCANCGKSLTDHKAEPVKNAPPKPRKAPQFSRSVPEPFRDGFTQLWEAAQSEKASYVVVSAGNKLLDVLLRELEVKAKSLEKPKPGPKPSFLGFGQAPKPPGKPTFSERMKSLQSAGLLLRGTVEASTNAGLATVLSESIDAGAVTSDMAKRYVQLLWQVADQGFEQPSWSDAGAPPKANSPPPEPGKAPDGGH